jgi:hypothetical protein
VKKLLTLALTLVALSLGASIALNSSRSNIYRLIYPAGVVSQTQATAILADLDKLGPANEATVKHWLAQNFKRHGVQADHVKEILFVPADKTRKLVTIALLTNSKDEPAALAATCPECVPVRHPPSKPNL